MNMRWAWTLPVLSALIATAVVDQARAQGGPAPVGYPAGTMAPQAMGIDPAMLAAMQAGPPAGAYQPATMYMPAAAFGQAAGYPQGPMMYPPQSIQPVAYMAAGGEGGPGPQMAVGPTPDVYGSYGYMPAEYAGQGYGPQGYGPQGYGPPGYGPPGYGPPGYGPAAFGGPGMAPGPYGMQGYAQQASYDGAGFGGSMYGPGPGIDGSCGYCGGNGCDMCRGGIFGHGRHGGDGAWMPNGLLGDCLGVIAPYPDGGCAAPRWFDFAVDYMMLKRDDTGRNQVFTTLGINGANGGVVLETDDLDFGSYRPGFRFIAAFQLAAANSLEFTYFGQFNYTASATVRSPNSLLFSVVSDFGQNPPLAVNPVPPPPFTAGFSETDFSDFQQLRYISKFDSFEINWRCRWMAPNCRYQGSWTAGVRHFILDEKLRYFTQSSINGVQGPQGFVPAQARFDVDTTNNLTGLQFGTDVWICLLPGLRAGGELQAGVYGNHMNINTTIGSTLRQGDFQEELKANDVAFIGQANLLMTYRINYQWTLRGGYTFLFVDGVALASENFNTAPPEIFTGVPRPEFRNDDGNVFYHGWNVGLEYMW